ncbi:hypothetical protein [Bradyrhizobium sp.]|uniref:hypothetical protein n=1 Tax=Bradyrhizobium sp. TaxID=376 RepID=UPI00262284B1|nr:hypothetical protein [Bradyrhizobium sp.]
MKIMRCVLLAVLLAGAAQAEWAKKDYSAEYDVCLPPCDHNHPKEHDKCVSYCACVTDGMQTHFTNHDQMTREVVQRKIRDQIASLQKIANSCNLKHWGSAAHRLRF